MTDQTKPTIKILVVDDEPNVLRMVSYTMQIEGFEVITAQNGAEALNKALTESPDLVLLDVMLPDMSGVEVCTQLRKKPETINLPVIILSAMSQVPDKIKGLEAGADEYITKPVTPGELVARVKALLARYEQVHRPLPKQTGKVLGFIGAKGGVGTTTVALNIAAALAKQQKKVVAAEIRSSYGTFANQLNLTQPLGLPKLLTLDPGKISERDVSSLLINLPSGIGILVGPQGISEYRSIEPQQLENIISIFTAMVDDVILDLPCHPSAANMTALRRCDFVVFVIEPETAALASGIIALELMKSWGVYRNRVGVVVVNRAPLAIPTKLDQLKSALGYEVLGVIPVAAEAMITSQRVGVPVFLNQPGSDVSKAFGEITKKIYESTGWL